MKTKPECLTACISFCFLPMERTFLLRYTLQKAETGCRLKPQPSSLLFGSAYVTGINYIYRHFSDPSSCSRSCAAHILERAVKRRLLLLL